MKRVAWRMLLHASTQIVLSLPFDSLRAIVLSRLGTTNGNVVSVRP
jgi:hypothetical protein